MTWTCPGQINILLYLLTKKAVKETNISDIIPTIVEGANNNISEVLVVGVVPKYYVYFF